MTALNINPERDPEKARDAAFDSLTDRMPDNPFIANLARLDREFAIAAFSGCVPMIKSILAETNYLDAKYGYGIRPWLPICWAGWKPAEPESE